jgi:UDP-4-keto-D-QuiNAc 4-reductase
VADTVLVTGAAGFVGSALVSELGLRGDTETVAATRSDRPLHGRVRRLHAPDLGPEADWGLGAIGATHVVHCASRVHVRQETFRDPSGQWRTVNTEGTIELARQAVAAGVRRFVFLSTVKVHGESSSPHRPFTEKDSPDPRDPYARSKLEAEEGLREVASGSGMAVVIIRPVLVYGPGVKGNFHVMMRAVHRRVPLPFGSVQNHRSLIGLSNLIDLILVCLWHPAAANQVFLASDGADLTTPALLRMTGEALGRPARLVPVPPALLGAGFALFGARDRAHRILGSLQVDIGKARGLLGWNPPVPVEVELARTADHFLSRCRRDSARSDARLENEPFTTKSR